MVLDFKQLIQDMERNKASDLHLKPGSVPIYRIHGVLTQANHPVLAKEEVQALAEKLIPPDLMPYFHEHGAVDFAFGTDKNTRFRTNVFRQKGMISIALRRLTAENLDIEELGLPPILYKIAMYLQGMVLVTGPTGCGKSTTMAALINQINATRREHIITIEDPIEFVFRDKMSVIQQREVGLDTSGFEIALRHALREDPDVILIGEMRDRETIMIAMRAALTGHLVISTLHTTTALQTINRIQQYFDPSYQTSLREELSLSLKAVLSQRLVPALQKGRVPVFEILIVNDIVRNLIRENRAVDVERVIQNREEGMQSADQHLAELVRSRVIKFETGLMFAHDQAHFKRMVEGLTAGTDRSAILGGMG
ncbi:MAG: type IV pilus twitching motility protein PilT [Candidatus Sumerlaeia bacterium]